MTKQNPIKMNLPKKKKKNPHHDRIMSCSKDTSSTCLNTTTYVYAMNDAKRIFNVVAVIKQRHQGTNIALYSITLSLRLSSVSRSLRVPD